MENNETKSSETGSGPVRACCGGHHGKNLVGDGQIYGGNVSVSGGHDPAQGGHGRVPGGVTRREFLQVTGASALGAQVALRTKKHAEYQYHCDRRSRSMVAAS